MLEERSVQVEDRKSANVSGGSLTTFIFAAVPALFRDKRRLLVISGVCRDYDKYHGLNANPEPASAIDYDALFDQNLLWGQAGHAVELSEQRLNGTRMLVKEVGCAVPVSKKGYVAVVYKLTR